MAFKKHELVLASLATIFLLAMNNGAVYAAVTGPGTVYIPSYSIYGTPSLPSSVAVLNSTEQLWGPYVNTIYVTWFTTQEAIIEALVNGYIQYDNAGVTNVQQYNQLLPYQNSGELALNISAGDSFGYIGFNTNKFPFSDVWFRRAVQQLTNYQTLSQAVDNGILGIASPYYFLPQIYGQYFGASEAQVYQQQEEFSLSAATQDLKNAGLLDTGTGWTFANGTALPAYTIYASSGPGSDLEQAELESMTNNAAQINLTITISFVTFNSIIGTILPSGSEQMYTLGWSLGTPISPTWVYFIFGDYALNTYYQDYVNQTIWNEVAQLESNSATQALANQYAVTAATQLQSQLPYVILAWSSSLTPVNTQSWRAYTLEPPYGTLFPGDVHPINATFGTLYRFGNPDGPDTYNVWTATSLYDFNVIGLQDLSALQVSPDVPTQIIADAAINYTLGSSAGTMPNGHAYNGTTITMNFNPNVYFEDGVPLTALDYNFSLWYFDVGGFTTSPYNSQDDITIDPGVTINYTAEANSPALEYWGSVPGFIGSYVPANNPYQVTVYFNGSSIFNLQGEISGLPILPEHIYANINPTTIPNQGTTTYLSDEAWPGQYGLNQWSNTESYTSVTYVPSYFLSNPLSIQQTVTAGSAAAFSMTATTFGGATTTSSGWAGVWNPVTGASGTVYVLNPTTLATIASYPLAAGSGGTYTASIPTGSLAVGSYTLEAILSWTGASYPYFGGSSTTANTYFSHQYSTLNVVAQTVSTTTTTSTSQAQTTTTTPTTVQTTTSQAATTSSSPSTSQTTTTPTSTTTTAATSSTAEYLVLAIIVVAVVIALVAIVARRGKPAMAPAATT